MQSTPGRRPCRTRRLASIAHNLVSSPVLGFIERLVGRSHQPVSQLLIFADHIFDRQHGQPDGYGEPDGLTIERPQVFFSDAAANPFGDLLSVMQLGLRQKLSLIHI